MSYVRPFVVEEDRPDAAAIEAHVLASGGQMVASGTQVALAVLGGRPALLRMKGPGAVTQAMLLRNGIGPPRDIRASSLSEMAQTRAFETRDKTDIGKVHDLPGGEARLREVMEGILADISPRMSALMAGDAMGREPTDPTGSGTVAAAPSSVWRNTAECLDALAPLLEIGRDDHIPPDFGAVVDFLTKDLSDETRDRMTTLERVPPAHLVLATPGLGKTRSVQALIEALPSQAVVWVFQPTLRKADEFARDMAGSARPVRVFRGRGASVAEGATEAMCKRHATAAEVAEKGLSVKKMLCGIDDPVSGGTCPHASTCAYLVQMSAIEEHQGGGVFVMTHASLTRPPPFPEPHLVIIDEDPSASLPQLVQVAARAMSPDSDWASLLEDENDDLPRRSGMSDGDDIDLESGDNLEAPEAVLLTLEQLLQGLAAVEPLRAIATTMDIAELEAALKVVSALERKLRTGLAPGGSDQALREAVRVSPVLELGAVRTVLLAILQEVRLFCAGVIDRSVFNGLSISHGDDGQVRSVMVHRLARTAIKSSVPIIVLDGTADPVLIGRALRRGMRVARIDVERQGEIIQCLGRGFSTASLAPRLGYPLAPSTIAEREQLWKELTTVLGRELDRAPGGVLVVSTLAVEIEAQRRSGCARLLREGLVWTHFGATRGINSFTDLQTIVLIGRKQPPAAAVQAIARAYFALDPRPFDPAASDYVVRRRTLCGKKGHASPTTIQTHPDPRVNRVLWQMREAEVIQAIDRVRAVRFPRRILILNALDLQRPDDDAGRPDLGVPADVHLSWPELHNGGNRAETVLSTTGGFLPIAPKALARIAPELFPSAEAAKKWLHRTDLHVALACHSEHLMQLAVRPAGQRGVAWPLLVDRRRFPCPSSARVAFEAMLGIRMAIWVDAADQGGGGLGNVSPEI
jgi:hypothetical protein